MRWGRLAAFVLAVALVAALTPAAVATFPFPSPTGKNPYDYTKLHITNGSCDVGPGQARPAGSDLPGNFDCRNDWKLTSYAAQEGDPDYDPSVADNPQELFGVKGSSTNLAWEVSTGRPDTVIAVMDSGIRWDENRPELVNKFYLNRGELPVPGSNKKGRPLRFYDKNKDSVFNVKDYAGDARAIDHPDDVNTLLDPSDLIRTFSDGVDDDGNGYVDDISGWDFFEGDNDANDDVDYGHGTGESEDSGGETETGLDPQCPNCMLLEMRVGDSFIADINHWAEAVVYAVDNGASVVQEALGTLNHTAFAQAAADYAYANGVVIVASEADESAGHHNYPAALNHTMVVNSVNKFEDPVQVPRTYLSFNGCTNFGGYTWVSVPSSSCSSDATAQSAGIAGLLYSAARNAVDKGVIAPGPSGRPVSAEEAKQLIRASADDIDFSTPKPPNGPPNNFATSLPASQRFVTTAEWDQIHGWGRINADAMVRLIAAGNIPPEADIVSPRWWQPLGTTGTVEVVGRVAAPRAASYTYEVQFAPGVQPPRWPASDSWTTVASGSGTSAKSGVLGTLDLAQVRRAIDLAPPPYTPSDDPTSRDLPEKDAFRVRIVVRDDRSGTPDAIEQRHYFALPDAGLLEHFPRFLTADGAGSPAFDDLDGDGVDELVIGDGDGFVHAFKADGSEAPGWPVHTDPIRLPTTGSNAYTRGAVPSTVYAAILLGSPTVADLDRDGDVEVAVADIEGFLHVWSHDGTVVPGFPVRGNPRFSEESGCQAGTGATCDDYGPYDVRDPRNATDRAFTANPSAGNLDPADAALELVAGSNDGHVYAWNDDGTAVPGWPVLLHDPAKTTAVDPVTHRITQTPDGQDKWGRKVLITPSLGDVDGDGDLEVAANVNEEYDEDPNWSGFRDLSIEALGVLADPGNTRAYLLHHDGTLRDPTAAQQATPHPDDQAYVAGWPAKVATLTRELLPYVGEGSNGAPVLADVNGDGALEIGTASIAGAGYLLRANGSSFYGNGPDGKYVTMASSASEFKSDASDGPSFASIGGGVFGRLGGSGSPVSFAMGATGLRRLLDVVLPEQQLGAEDHISAWNTTTGSYDPGFPAQVNDLMFFNTPAVADVTGDGLADVLQSTAMYDLQAYTAGGRRPLGWPKQTGGWSVSTPGTGDLDGDGGLDVALMTREGNLFVWESAGSACGPQEWPKYQHDLWNSGRYGFDARRPGVALDLTVERQPTLLGGSQLVVSWTAPGDDGPCGRAAAYEITVNGQPVCGPSPSAAGTREGVILDDPGGAVQVAVQAVDDAGNRGMAKTASVGVSTGSTGLRAV